jgi:GcrA cell cycle regulator
MDWTEEVIARLRILWQEGHSTAEIGRRLAVSKNAVVGKAHRLMLSPRPSPIRRGNAAEPVAAGPVVDVVEMPAPRLELVEALVAEAPLPVPAAPPRVERPVLRAVPVPRASRTHPCCWPVGEPGTANFHFCDAASAGGKPYCAAHAALAYVKVRERRDEAAA